jgi:hypothetical protein
MAETKGSLLRFCVWYALGGVKVHIGRRFYPLGLSAETRTQIAADVVRRMRQYGQWRELDDEVIVDGAGPSWADQRAAERSKDQK